MKDKILMLIIGALIGAIIASGCFLIFGKNTSTGKDRMNGKNFDTNMIGGGQMGTPPNRDGNSIGEPPAAPTTSTDTSENA